MNGLPPSLIAVALLLAGCASGTTDMARLYRAAVTAQGNSDWEGARQAWARVVAASRSSGASPEQRAVYHYEYGRSLGVTCHFEEAERELLEAYRLDVETEGPAYMSLTELARLNLDRKRYAEAAGYFARILAETDEETLDEAPIARADILDEYAEALSGSGQPTQAAEMREQAKEIRLAHPQGHSVTQRTPYGSRCR